MSKKLEKLLEKREQLNAEIQKARARETAQKRKEDTRRKILLGALVIEMMDKGELDDGVIMKRLEGFLTRDIDRKLFDFPVKGDDKVEDKKPVTTQGKKPTSSKKTTELKGANKGSSEPEDSEVELEDLSVEIILEEYPSDKKIAILKMVRGVTNLGLKDGKDLIEEIPSMIKKTTQSEADVIKKELEALGAKVTLKVEESKG
ncbi:MAG: ribosomal protein L7/L12 [Crocosphaera sp.]